MVLKFHQAVISYGSLEILWNQFYLISAGMKYNSFLNLRFISLWSFNLLGLQQSANSNLILNVIYYSRGTTIYVNQLAH